MQRWMTLSLVPAILALSVACGGGAKNAGQSDTKAKEKPASEVFGPLDVGGDWQDYTKMNTEPVESEDHGNRFVDTYVNDVGAQAYKTDGAEIPVGTVIVKTSWERDGDQPSTTPGPIFVMEKRAAGFDPENSDWYYALHWEQPTGRFADRGPLYFRSPSKRVNYCFECHNDYDRQLGMVPQDKRAP